MSKRLFPIPDVFTKQHPRTNPPSIAQKISYSSSPWTVMALYELALTTGLLLQAGRFLTLCCSCEQLGGLDSRPGAVRALVISVELLYQNLRHMSLSSAVEALQFTFRLEDMVGCYADELLGDYDISDTIPGYVCSNAPVSGVDENTITEPVENDVVASIQEDVTYEATVDANLPADSFEEASTIETLITAPTRSFGVYSGAGTCAILLN